MPREPGVKTLRTPLPAEFFEAVTVALQSHPRANNLNDT